MLQQRSLCVCEITDIIQLATSTVSKHLSILRDAGFIIEQKDGKWVNYGVNSRSTDQRVIEILTKLDFWIEDSQVIEDDKQKVVLSVEDSGYGIDPHEYQRVFDRFYRVGGDQPHPAAEPVPLLRVVQRDYTRFARDQGGAFGCVRNVLFRRDNRLWNGQAEITPGTSARLLDGHLF